LILWVAAALAFLAEWQEPGNGMDTLGFAIVGVVLVNAVFSFWQEFWAEQAMAALQKLLPHEAKVLRDGKTTQVPADELTPGDVILLDDGDDIPADCRLIEGFGVRVNNATMTGESLPQARDAQPSNEQELLRSRNVLLAGMSVVAGPKHARIPVAVAASNPTPEPLGGRDHRRLGRLFFLIGQLLGLSFGANVLFAIGIIVANVPEGLLHTITLALTAGNRQREAEQAACS
jgi:P-type E1-E2 ATPase